MNVVVLAPHADDEALGCGGTLAKLIEQGYDVYCYAFSTGLSNQHEFNRSVLSLGGTAKCYKFLTRTFSSARQQILDQIIDIKNEIQPKIVFLPAHGDCHQDHQVITQEGIRAFKHSTIYGCEYPWNSFNFSNGCYSALSQDHVNRKLAALRTYESQDGKIYFKEENILSLARVRGMQANSEYAECFEVIRHFL